MKDKVAQLIANIPNQSVEVSDKSNIYQCMDLAYLWVFILGFPKATIQRLYAYEVYTKPNDLTKKYFELIPNTIDVIPEAGWLAVWSNKIGVAGHIAVVAEGSTKNVMKSLDQNWKTGQPPTIISHNYDNVLGFLKPKPQPNEACLVQNDSDGQALFQKLVHNSDIADNVVRRLELGNSADGVSYETIDKSLAARDGKLTTCNTNLNSKDAELSKATQEIENRIEQVSRLQKELLDKEKAHLAELTALKSTMPDYEKSLSILKTQLEQVQGSLKEEAKAKGIALSELAETQSKLESALKNQFPSLTFSAWLKLLSTVKWS